MVDWRAENKLATCRVSGLLLFPVRSLLELPTWVWGVQVPMEFPPFMLLTLEVFTLLRQQ